MGLQLERISLGAMVIAMGMLVDNAIVVAEGMCEMIPLPDLARPAPRRSEHHKPPGWFRWLWLVDHDHSELIGSKCAESHGCQQE